jgi:hypothetical protein
LSWGRVCVQDRPQPLKDAKLYPGGAREWDWSETGTRHAPGIQPADVEELLKGGAAVVVLSTGMLGRLEVTQETFEYLEGRNTPVHVLRTKEAVRLYNRLAVEAPVGALIHSTC